MCPKLACTSVQRGSFCTCTSLHMHQFAHARVCTCTSLHMNLFVHAPVCTRMHSKEPSAVECDTGYASRAEHGQGRPYTKHMSHLNRISKDANVNSGIKFTCCSLCNSCISSIINSANSSLML